MLTDKDSEPHQGHAETHKRDTVAIVDTDRNIADATRQLIDMLGGMSGLLAGRQIAILKPNFVAGRPARTGATTNLELIATVAEQVHAAGATPLLYETPGTEFDYSATLKILGLEDFCHRHEIGIISPDQSWVTLQPPGARRLKRFRIPEVIAEASLINLPVLKTHVVSGVSFAMKNLMGLLPLEDRRSMHTLGIQQCIVDLNRGVIPALNIVDGSVGQDRDGPLYGRAANLGMLVGGRDSLSVDLICAQLIGVDPQIIGHLQLGVEQLGARSPRSVGVELEVKQRFELPNVHPLYRLAFWLMYPLDYPFHFVTGDHLCAALYRTGLVGTRPKIVESLCTRCGDCVNACPVPNTIDLQTLQVNPRTCERCLLCFDVCPEGAIVVRGMSGTVADRQIR
ncbi:MAG TPA: DUF362 domain-containing protein [Chloroflexota bacterium]|nr:DUF362 domain-containing protein [Chloroflexota bacterium]